MKVAFSTRTSVNHPIVLGILYYCMMMGVPEITEQYIFLLQGVSFQHTYSPG
jgi:hypothetical protein